MRWERDQTGEGDPSEPGGRPEALGPLGRAVFALLVAAAAVGTFVGYRAFYFLTDDAFISFRYVANAMAGLGFVWNPPPFAPVEGYTSFLWVAILRAAWSLTGLEPPEVAGWLSLACGYATLALGVHLLWRMELPPRMRHLRLPLLALVLVGTVANRTFLAWLSSGLETALFNLTLTGWLHAGLARPERRTTAWVARLATWAALAALARPDGMLCVAATLLILVHEQARLRSRPSLARVLAASPLLAFPAHLAYRLVSYGEWLPNTYYAKHVAPWPAAGVRYLACFVLENGFWVWLLLGLAATVGSARRVSARSLFAERFAPSVAVLTLVAHFGFYTLVVGGDHFEYRVYSHLVLLGFVSAAWLATRVRWHPAVATAALLLFVLASLPIGWAHWDRTHTITTRRFKLIVPVAQSFPEPLRAPVEAFDTMQAWLISRYVGMRHAEHRQFWIRNATMLPSREEGAKLPWRRRPVLAIQSVGIVGWVLPHVAVIDTLGLNDYVIARTPIPPSTRRAMAHDRHAPPGYVQCFRPNVQVDLVSGRVKEEWRSTPLDDATIAACERRYRHWLEAADPDALLRRPRGPRRSTAPHSQSRNRSTAMTAEGESSTTTMRAALPDHAETSHHTTSR